MDNITIHFEKATVVFNTDDYQIVRGQRYNLTQFGEIVGGEGKDWETAAFGFFAPVTAPVSHKFDDPNKLAKAVQAFNSVYYG